MSLRNGLTPEVRLDRNGKPVRRWVRDRPLPASLPARPYTLKPPMGKAERDQREDIQRALAHWCSHEDMLTIIDRLIDYSSETIGLINGSLGNRETNVYWAEAGTLIKEFGEERTVREYMVLSGSITDCEDLRATIAYINGLSAYGCFEPDDLSTLDDDERRLARALLKTAFHLSCVDEAAYAEEKAGRAPVLIADDCNTIADPELLAVFLDHPDRAEDLWEFIARAPGELPAHRGPEGVGRHGPTLAAERRPLASLASAVLEDA